MTERIGEAVSETETNVKKIDFIQKSIDISWNELAEILPSEENGEISPNSLNESFNLVDLLKENLADEVLPKVFRNHAEKYGGKTLIEVMQEGRSGELFSHYQRVFNWSSTG